MTEQEIAAHRVADALRIIAECLPRLSVEQLNAYHPDAAKFQPQVAEVYKERAARLDASVPFQPLTDVEKQELFEQVQEELADESTRDRARDYMDEPEWVLRDDYDSRKQYMNEEE